MQKAREEIAVCVQYFTMLRGKDQFRWPSNREIKMKNPKNRRKKELFNPPPAPPPLEKNTHKKRKKKELKKNNISRVKTIVQRRLGQR